MTPEILAAMQTVVDYLDEQMNDAPNRELADTSNYLQAIIDKETKK